MRFLHKDRVASWRNRLLEHDANPCQHPNAGAYCPDCGREMAAPPRYSFQEMLGAPTELWLKKGFRRTLFGLFRHPGPSIRTFLFRDRNHLVKPAAYLLLAMALRLWVTTLLDGKEVCAADDGICQLWRDSALMLEMIQIGVFALIYRMFFRKAGLNLWEYGIGFAYIVAQSFVLGALLSLALAFAGPILRVIIVFLATNIYVITAAIQLLEIRGIFSRLGAWLPGMLSVITFAVIFVGLGELQIEDAAAPPPEATSETAPDAAAETAPDAAAETVPDAVAETAPDAVAADAAIAASPE